LVSVIADRVESRSNEPSHNMLHLLTCRAKGLTDGSQVRWMWGRAGRREPCPGRESAEPEDRGRPRIQMGTGPVHALPLAGELADLLQMTE
jgi:hypothetical protein